MAERQIIAIGGGGFSEEPDNPLLDIYVLEQTRKTKPKICFLPTASGDSEGYIERFYKSFSRYSCEPSHLSLFKPATTDFEDFLLNQDIVYIGGGNTKNMLVIWKEWSIDSILKKAWERNVVLAGISAGAMCWFEHGASDYIPGKITVLPCLGFIEGSCCPHYDGEPLRRNAVPVLISEGKMKSGYAIDNSAAIHYVDGRIKQAVSSIKNKKVSYISSHSTEQLQVRYLGIPTP